MACAWTAACAHPVAETPPVRSPTLPAELVFYSPGGPVQGEPGTSIMAVGLHLRADGSFKMFYSCTDHDLGSGRWKALSETDLELRSGWVRRIRAGRIIIHAGHDRDYWMTSVPEIRRDLLAYLEAHPLLDVIPAEDLQAIQRRTWEDWGLGGRKVHTTQKIRVTSETVSRDEVVRAVEALDLFYKSDDKNVIHVKRLKHGSRTFLYWFEGGGGDWGLSESELRHAIDSKNNDLLRILFEIPKEEFPGGLPR